MDSPSSKPIVLITGAAGNLGASVAKALQDAYRVVGMDLKPRQADFPILKLDLGSDDSVELALRNRHFLEADRGLRCAGTHHRPHRRPGRILVLLL